MNERLYRSEREKILGGVCGGLAEYFRVDVVLVRLFMVLMILAGGIGFVVYLAAWIILPPNPLQREGHEGEETWVKNPVDTEAKEKRVRVAGVFLVIIGCLFLVADWFPWLSFSKLWPLFLILIGVGVIWRGDH